VCDGIVRTPSEVASFAKCLHTKEKLLLRELGYGEEEMRFQVVGEEAIPKPLRHALEGATSTRKIVETYVNGDGVTYIMFLVVSLDPGATTRVSRFLLKASFPE
jgi:hypothetical protein